MRSAKTLKSLFDITQTTFEDDITSYLVFKGIKTDTLTPDVLSVLKKRLTESYYKGEFWEELNTLQTTARKLISGNKNPNQISADEKAHSNKVKRLMRYQKEKFNNTLTFEEAEILYNERKKSRLPVNIQKRINSSKYLYKKRGMIFNEEEYLKKILAKEAKKKID